MKFCQIVVALYTLNSAAAAVIKPSTVVKPLVKNRISNALRELCLPDVNLPDKSILKDKDLFANLKSLTVISSVDLIRFGTVALPITNKMKGKKKKNNAGGLLTDLHNYYIDSVVEHKDLLPEGYKYFGNNNNVENLKPMLQNNAFYASALVCKSGSSTFAVNSVETGNGPKSWYSMLVSALEDSYPRINAVFSSTMDLLSFDVVDPVTGKNIKSSKTKEEAAGDLLYTMTFYTEAFHALIHVFHYINVVAIGEADSVYPMLSLWSKPYIANVALKYEEVEQALLPDKGGVLTGGTWRTKDPVLVKTVLREMLCKWGSCKTANQFVDEFLFKTLPQGKVRKAGLLPEFFKHVDLVAPFAKELSGSFENYDKESYAKANRAIETVTTT